MHSSEENSPWVVRWKYEMSSVAARPGIWRLRSGGFFVRARVMDPRTGREIDVSRVLRGSGISLQAALRVQDQLRLEDRERVQGKMRSRMLWSEYAASLFEAKVADGTIQSVASRQRWADTLARLVPRFGRYHVDAISARLRQGASSLSGQRECQDDSQERTRPHRVCLGVLPGLHGSLPLFDSK